MSACLAGAKYLTENQLSFNIHFEKMLVQHRPTMNAKRDYTVGTNNWGKSCAIMLERLAEA
jgi:hypothetical protein